MTRVVVMGVSGCGKSSIGAAVADRLGARFIDGDDLHPPENIAKMARGTSLEDADRAPWLDRVGEVLATPQTVMACSALKRRYRDQIRARSGAADVVFLFLHGSRDVLMQRMATRPGHFMPVSLLDSQLAALEPPDRDESHVAIDIDASPTAICDTFLAALKETP
jgi:carbohydrate kinase (thermoresistant glucokinase family)